MRKFLVVVDETPECLNAMRFAARRAERTGGVVTMLYVITSADFEHWMGVADVMRAEAREAAEKRLTELGAALSTLCGIVPEFVIREGTRTEEVLKLIEEDKDIAILVLGAGTGEGPGPLVTHVVSKLAGRMPIPVTVVPGGLSLERIDAIS